MALISILLKNKNEYMVDVRSMACYTQLGLPLLHLLFQYESTFAVLKASAHPVELIQSGNYIYLCSSGSFSAVLYCSILRIIILSIVHLCIQSFPHKRCTHISAEEQCSNVSLELLQLC